MASVVSVCNRIADQCSAVSVENHSSLSDDGRVHGPPAPRRTAKAHSPATQQRWRYHGRTRGRNGGPEGGSSCPRTSCSVAASRVGDAVLKTHHQNSWPLTPQLSRTPHRSQERACFVLKFNCVSIIVTDPLCLLGQTAWSKSPT